MSTFVDAFLGQAALHPGNPAVMDRAGAFTYAQLNRESALLARRLLDACMRQGCDVEALRRAGKSGARVAVLLPRTREYMVALLAVLRAGCALIPIDADYPKERVAAILRDGQARLCVTTARLAAQAEGIETLQIEDALAGKADEEADEALNLSDNAIEGMLLFTSGSTGRPKGVLHRQALFTYALALLEGIHDFTPRDVTCCMAGFTFIVAQLDLTTPLMTGGSVYIADENERQNADRLFALIQKRRLTGMYLPPQMFATMRELYGRLPLDYVLLVGEKARADYAGDGNLYELYGSTECALPLLHHMVPEEDPRMLGNACAGTRVCLLDGDGGLIEGAGKLGELCVVTPWMAEGYIGLPKETGERFAACPFEPGGRMYRTGDYMAYDEGGSLLFHGRRDRMVKLRGYRVELGEIENVMRRAPGVADAACVVVKVGGGDKLCCYYRGEKAEPTALKAHAGTFLPGYMVPDYCVWMEAFPLNERSKVDYLALAAMEPPAEEGEYTAPENEMERQVCAAFARTLDLVRVSATADFFELGGTSLSVAVLIADLARLREGLSFQDVTRHPTPRALTAYLTETGGQAHGVPDMDRDFYPLTRTQMGIYLEAMTGGSAATYTLPYLMRCEDGVTAQQLIRAIRAVVAAHPSMKYVIRAGADGMGRMFMVPEAQVEIPVVDGDEAGRLDFMVRFVPVVPMLDSLLFHFAVYRTPRRCYLALKTHLIFMDASAISLFIAELNRALGDQPLLSEKYTVQQVGMSEEAMMRNGFHEAAKQYHAKLFKAMDDIPALMGDREGPLTPGVSENLRYEPGTLTTRRVRAFCEKNQITEGAFFMGAMAILLGKYLNSRQVSFSTVYNGRALAGTENTIGTLIKRIPVYGDLSRNMQVQDFLRTISSQLVNSMANDIYSFDEVLKTCPVNEDVEFIYQGDLFTDRMGASAGRTLVEGDKWFMEHYHTGMVTGCFSIQFFATDGLYNATLEYRNERFSPKWVRRFAQDLFTIAEGLLSAERIGQIGMLTDADREALARFNDTAVDIGFTPVHEQIRRWAKEKPDAVAVTWAGNAMTFGELDALSDRAAAALRRMGVGRDGLVGVLFDREARAYVAQLGILKAGGAFVPFIPGYPDERVDFCMADGGIRWLVTTAKLKAERIALAGRGYEVLALEDLLEGDAGALGAVEVRGQDLAYCIYTSGTTGRPKGVMIEHGNIANYVHRNEKSPEIMHYAAPGRVSLALASFSFDVSVVEAFLPLCNGNPVVIATEEEIHTPALLARLIAESGVNGMTCTPTYLMNLLDIPQTREALRQIAFFDIGAEAFPAQLYERLQKLRDDSVIMNVYGPTEATMGCSAELMSDRKPVTVGRPIANTSFYVADLFGNPLPVGIRGELIICGAQVGRGYVNLPDKTAAAFFIHEGVRAYHSGDLAAWMEDGRMRVFGRADNQIKLRGFRIELDEIEKVMGEYPGVKLGAAAVQKNGGAEHLVGYYTARRDIDPSALKAHMQEKLPEYMVPSVLVALDAMPMTASGKVDRMALPKPDFAALRAGYAAPETDGERAICAAFAAALKLDAGGVGALDDFFELGGDSLRAMVALTEAGLDGLTAADIFQKRTPRAIAAAAAERAGQGSLMDREMAARGVPHALTPLQLQMIDTQLFRPDSTMWSNTHILARFSLDVDAERLCRAVNAALQNHPALSTAFAFGDAGELEQRYIPGLLPEVKVRDIRAGTAEMLPDVLVLPFQRILNACLCRVGVYRSPEYVYLFLDVHHLLMDGASLGVVLSDVVNAYYGRELKPDCYFALLADEERRVAASSREKDRAWFMERYGEDDWCNMPPVVGDPIDISQASRQRRLAFDADQVSRAEQHWGVTHSVMAIASALLALHRFTGKPHVMVNWIFNNRLSPQSAGAVGMLIKNLPCAARMEDFHSLRALLDSVKEQVAEGIAHSTYDFMTEHYQAYLDDCMEVNLQLGINAHELAALNPTFLPLEDAFSAAGARLELELLENEYGDGGFDSEMEYAQGLFDAGQMEAFHDLYVGILEGLIHMTIDEDIGE